MSRGINRKLLNHLRLVIEEKDNYPIGILAYFGPDDKQITKAVAVIVQDRTSPPSYKSWNSPEFISDSRVASEIGQYFLDNLVTEVVMTEGVVGCPHEEGIDFPYGKQCPKCPFWADYPN